ncbi:peptidase M24 [Salinibacter sp. 10B]|uniref:murein hydrolase activator EnvC family protein n=1 Tax=Salinibacter sp. 10B TaxID=1923971 RepID=UPI000CF4F6B4|nr:M23 family metallopeptidase [Salinibacter sp. 10B]PQJ35491.1 peptidase M24 [Salinibacter sp. 10B]
MWSFLTDLFRRPGSTHTVVVMDGEEVGRTRRYEVQPKRLFITWSVSLLVTILLGASLVAFTPLRTYIPGYGTEELRRNARLNAIRVAALQDSVAVQRHYIKRLQQLLTGQVDSVARTASANVQAQPTREPQTTDRAVPDPDQDNPNTQAHEQPAISATSFSVTARSQKGGAGRYIMPSLSLPVESPVETGFPTRNFDASDAHFGIDLAVSEGSLVRAVGEGYVVLSDWTQEGGYTVAVQHSDGYLSVYKHNKRLLKQTGDRVEAREALAVSGNSGEVTTGPHLHFELWRNGLAQDPRPYVTGW